MKRIHYTRRYLSRLSKGAGVAQETIAIQRKIFVKQSIQNSGVLARDRPNGRQSYLECMAAATGPSEMMLRAPLNNNGVKKSKNFVFRSTLSSRSGRHDRMSARCPLYPRKQTFAATVGMSAKCQKRTSTTLFNHLVGASD